MARKKREAKDSADKEELEGEGRRGFFGGFKEEVAEAILAIVFFLAAAFLLFAPFGKAGVTGETSYRLLGSLFGVGYYLAPALLVALGVSYLRALSRNLALPKAIGGFISFLAGLILIEMAFAGEGGAVGGTLESWTTAAFGAEFGAVAMVGLLVAGLIVVFDAPISLRMFSYLLNMAEEPAPAEAPDL
jgi:hypothetical protein